MEGCVKYASDNLDKLTESCDHGFVNCPLIYLQMKSKGIDGRYIEKIPTELWFRINLYREGKQTKDFRRKYCCIPKEE